MAVGILSAASIHLSGGMPGTTGTVLVPPSLQHDLQDGGLYLVHGTVHLDATPTDLPLRRRVQLYNQRDSRLIREAWSDATTGAYSFDGIRGGDGTRYFVAAFDHTQDKRAVIADNLTPEAM